MVCDKIRLRVTFCEVVVGSRKQATVNHCGKLPSAGVQASAGNVFCGHLWSELLAEGCVRVISCAVEENPQGVPFRLKLPILAELDYLFAKQSFLYASLRGTDL